MDESIPYNDEFNEMESSSEEEDDDDDQQDDEPKVGRLFEKIAYV